MFKMLAWVVVIWIVVSIVMGIKREGADSIKVIVSEYFYQLEKNPLITIVLTLVVVLILFGILF